MCIYSTCIYFIFLCPSPMWRNLIFESSPYLLTRVTVLHWTSNLTAGALVVHTKKVNKQHTLDFPLLLWLGYINCFTRVCKLDKTMIITSGGVSKRCNNQTAKSWYNRLESCSTLGYVNGMQASVFIKKHFFIFFLRIYI